MKRLKLQDIRPEVEIFGKKYRLPFIASDITDHIAQNNVDVTVHEVLDESYPGIGRAEADMLYLHLMYEIRKDVSQSLPKSRTVTFDGKEITLSFDDIQLVSKQEFDLFGVTWKFRKPSALEHFKTKNKNHTDILRRYLQHVEHAGEKYTLEEVGGKIDMVLGYKIDDIISCARLNLPDGTNISGFDALSEFFVTGKIPG